MKDCAKGRWLFAVLVGFFMVGSRGAEDPVPAAAGNATLARSVKPLRWQLPLALVAERDHAGAALEFRRLALEEADPSVCETFSWLAAYEYGLIQRWDVVANLLDDTEVKMPELMPARLLLRAELAATRQEYASAAFFLSEIDATAPPALRRYAARRRAVAEVKAGRNSAALKALEGSPGDELKGLSAVKRYARGSNKTPVVGGLLGFVPGLGYAYAGEYPNALRSAVLNGLFIFGMFDTAHKEQWGAFAVITVFEITWYSGSIYGGIDASYRFNLNRQQQAVTGIMDGADYAPDLHALPTLRLQFRF